MDGFNSRYVRRERTVGTRLQSGEYWFLKKLAAKNHVNTSDYIRGVITDALVEEGFDARCFGSERNSQSREGREASGATTQ